MVRIAIETLEPFADLVIIPSTVLVSQLLHGSCLCATYLTGLSGTGEVAAFSDTNDMPGLRLPEVRVDGVYEDSAVEEETSLLKVKELPRGEIGSGGGKNPAIV